MAVLFCDKFEILKSDSVINLKSSNLNKDNGQQLTYSKNLNKTDQCPVRAILNIDFRALRLKVDTKGPLAVHATGAKHKTVNYITNVNKKKHLREIAVITYNLTDNKYIQR